jgi:hypothetical protein
MSQRLDAPATWNPHKGVPDSAKLNRAFDEKVREYSPRRRRARRFGKPAGRNTVARQYACAGSTQHPRLGRAPSSVGRMSRNGKHRRRVLVDAIAAEEKDMRSWRRTVACDTDIAPQMTATAAINERSCMRRVCQMMLLSAAVCTVAFGAQAQNLNYLKNSPISYFQQDDVDLMNKAANEVLESSGANAKKDWSNPRTGASGSARVLSQFTATDGAPCKRLRVINKAPQAEGESTYTVCKYEGRGWILHPDAKPAS